MHYEELNGMQVRVIMDMRVNQDLVMKRGTVLTVNDVAVGMSGRVVELWVTCSTWMGWLQPVYLERRMANGQWKQFEERFRVDALP